MSRINEHLVATEGLSTGKFRVLGLPAGKLERVIETPRFQTLYLAEQYIREHLPADVVVVFPTDITEDLEQRRAEQQGTPAIIVRQRPDLTAYQEGQVDGRMRRGVVEQHTYPYMRDVYQGPSTLAEALAQEKRNIEEFLLGVTAESRANPEDIAYLQGKLSCF